MIFFPEYDQTYEQNMGPQTYFQNRWHKYPANIYDIGSLAFGELSSWMEMHFCVERINENADSCIRDAREV